MPDRDCTIDAAVTEGWPYGYGFCCCGCGERTPVNKRTRPDRGYVAGQPTRFIRYHNSTRSNIAPIERKWPFGYGRCHCGCGAETSIAVITSAARGLIAGEPSPWIVGHNASVIKAPREDRFWAKVRRGEQNDCWEWSAGVDNFGYGRLNTRGVVDLAHRLSWELAHGPIPDGMCVLHRCDNPPCVNPRHLFLGTRDDNVQDMIAKGRHWRGPNWSGDHAARLA